MPCGRVRLDRRIIMRACCLRRSVMPSAPPMTKQTCSPFCRQLLRCSASSTEVGALPRSSRTTRNAPCGMASKDAFFFRRHTLDGIHARAAFFGFDFFECVGGVASEAFGVFGDGLINPTRHFGADCQDGNVQCFPPYRKCRMNIQTASGISLQRATASAFRRGNSVSRRPRWCQCRRSRARQGA